MSQEEHGPDMLESLFEMQSELNDYVFRKNSQKTGDGSQLTMDEIMEQAANGALSVNDLPNQWLSSPLN